MKTNSYTYILCFLYLLLSSCNQQEERQQTQQQQVLEVDAHLVEARQLNNTVSSTANLLPYEEVQLRAPVAGNVLRIYFKEGQQVEQGELLLKIDDRQLRAQREGLQAQLSSAQKELQRNEELLNIEGTSQEAVDQIRATVSNLQAQINELNVQINLANVNAPFDGQIGMRNFSQGAYLAQGDAITQLVQSNLIRVDFNLPAQYLPYLEEGQAVKVIDNSGLDTAQAVIYAINPLISAASRSIQLRAKLENDSLKFTPGNFAQVEVSLALDPQALMVPAEAVQPERDGHIVYKVQNGLALKQPVSMGIRTESRVQIAQGLHAGDTILITGLMQVSDSTEVEVRSLKEKAL
ncbi:efflux RND transporter periplasmic adaptor subunit [Catalinimonas sp. 4WD22]|uniref:efflux RND transporter periplasmic adaptor subunit n=1 Tax=Catalinimonas locisalis TaxID=3133978 RepID=UPI003100C56D